MNKFKNHPSIIMIENKKKNDQSFSFGLVTYDNVLKKLKPLDTAKASQQYNIPTRILKQNSDYFAEYFYKNINQCISKPIFPTDLKLPDVTPVYKKNLKNSKDDYRPVSQYFQNLRNMYLQSNSAIFQFFIIQISMRVSWRLQRTTLLDRSN